LIHAASQRCDSSIGANSALVIPSIATNPTLVISSGARNLLLICLAHKKLAKVVGNRLSATIAKLLPNGVTFFATF